VTVAIGLVCSDGVLVASDSMASDPATAHQATKVFKLNCCPVVWTASGSVYVIEEVETALAGIDQPNAKTGGAPVAFAQPNLPALRGSLKGAIVKTQRTCYESALASTPFAPGTTAANFVTSFLVCGYANATPWLLEFAHDGQVNWHTPLGFYSIGSGGPFARVAHALMAHYLSAPVSLQQGMQLAYRAIETTCEVSPSGVGLPVQIAVVDSAGARVLDTGEISEIRDLVARWKTLEADTLRMSPQDAKETAQGDLPSIGDEQAPPNAWVK
jgi:20S proteasome alpha/beta subunit